MDKLDAFDASYEMKYEDMQRRLDKLYAEASAIGAELEDAEIKVKSVEENRVTTERVYQLLDVFEDEFDDLPEDKKKEVIHGIVDSIELNPDADPKKHERIVKKIRFKCPVSFYHDLPESMRDLLGITQFNRLETTEYEFDENSRDKEDTVESIVLLSKLKSNKLKHINVELEMGELDLTAAESKATYEEIKDYVLKQSGLKVSNLYIAQVKQKCGSIERKNYNKSKSENVKQPQCSPEKEKAIRDALEHFHMI